MINDWAPETKDLLTALITAGFALRSGDNGEEKFKFLGEKNDLDKFVADCIACDEARVYVSDPNGKKLWLYLVLGNEPGVIVADYSLPAEGVDLIDPVTEKHYDKWSEMPQPMKPSPR